MINYGNGNKLNPLKGIKDAVGAYQKHRDLKFKKEQFKYKQERDKVNDKYKQDKLEWDKQKLEDKHKNKMKELAKNHETVALQTKGKVEASENLKEKQRLQSQGLVDSERIKRGSSIRPDYFTKTHGWDGPNRRTQKRKKTAEKGTFMNRKKATKNAKSRYGGRY